jgi:CubicO group peptidase (beta-lactamase class C family)
MSDLDAAIAALAARDAFSGVVRISRGERALFEGAYGWASRAWRISPTMATRFDTASITKLFTAVATLQQVEAGAFTLDTKAIPYLGLTGTSISPEATVRHLLTHSSGLGDDADEEAGESYEEVFRTRPNYSVRETIDLVPQFADKPANFAPGEGVRYCNCGFVLLGLMIERATGTPYRDVVRARVFAPAGMRDSDFLMMDRVHENFAEGTDPVDGGWKRNIYSYPPIGSPDGGAHVTAPDLARFAAALGEGRLLSRAMTDAMLAPQVQSRGTEDGASWWGYGPSMRVVEGGRVAFWQKEGANAGVSALLRHDPGRDLTLVVLANQADVAWPVARMVQARVDAGEFGA